jgi:NAD(P) transhydrogenase subunit alpha
MHASEMYARNLLNFSQLLIRDAALTLDWDDELIAKTCHAHDGALRNA